MPRSTPRQKHARPKGKKTYVVFISHFLTDNSVDNPNLMYEFGAATSLRKRVTPVIVGLDASKLPSLLKNMNYVKYPDLPKYISDLEKHARAA